MRINVTVAVDVDLDDINTGPVRYTQAQFCKVVAAEIEQVARPAVLNKSYGHVAHVSARRVYPRRWQ
jgi:hypothetical protein